MADWIFLDGPGRYLPEKKAIEAFSKDFLTSYANEEEAVEREKHELLSLFDAEGYTCIPTPGGASGPYSVLFSHCMDSIRETGKTHIMTPSTEVGAISHVIRQLEKCECEERRLEVDSSGLLTAASFAEQIGPRSGALSLSLAHPYTGVIQPIGDLARVCKEKEIALHVDVGSAIGKLFFTCSESLPDWITFDGRGIGSPAGFGVLLARGSAPSLHWGKGDFALAHYKGLKESVQRSLGLIDHFAMETRRLRDQLERDLAPLGGIPLFQGANRLPNTAIFLFPGIHAELFAFHLRRRGIFASCAAESLEGTGIPREKAHTALSFSLCARTSNEDVGQVVTVCKELFPKLEKVGGAAHATV